MSTADPAGGQVGVAVVGCGTISTEYLRNLTSFPDLRVLFCADLDLERAKAQAAAFGVPGAGSAAEALARPDVEIVVNLTVPAAHAAISSAAIAAGKSVWVEKPLTLDSASARELLAAADTAGVRIGCAPDTVLGAGLRRARRLIDSGAIGQPQTGLALLQGSGAERWHPDPEFLFKRGAGPLFDMGPYYLTALATIFGPATRVAAMGRRARPTRVIGSGPRAGKEFSVEVPTHVSALIDYKDHQSATIVLSCDSPFSRRCLLEVTGSSATLEMPDPNQFTGEVLVDGEVRVDGPAATTPASDRAECRGLGVLDLARGLRSGAPPRASGEIGLHVLEIMEAIDRSVATGTFESVLTSFTRPAALAEDWDPHASTLA
jgi:predicted dehydrogenase